MITRFCFSFAEQKAKVWIVAHRSRDPPQPGPTHVGHAELAPHGNLARLSGSLELRPARKKSFGLVLTRRSRSCDTRRVRNRPAKTGHRTPSPPADYPQAKVNTPLSTTTTNAIGYTVTQFRLRIGELRFNPLRLSNQSTTDQTTLIRRSLQTCRCLSYRLSGSRAGLKRN